MLKKYHLLVSLLLCIPAMNAERLTPEQAFSRAAKSTHRIRQVKNANSFRLADTLAEGDIYVFSMPGNKGYILVSGDDCAAPLLSYSESGEFSQRQLPPQLDWLIGEYARQIDYARNNNLSYSARKANSEVIPPILKTAWDQGAPFNNLCPSDKNGICYTGCVATAMAQVMNHWKHPSAGKGTHSFSWSASDDLTIDFSEREFLWDSMRDRYDDGEYSEKEGDAVAWLMKACGYSVDMKYSTTSSGALTALVPRAMRDYFDYSPGISYVERMAFSTSDWENIIVDNLKNYGPVIYNGYTQLSGGHSFVCDGYDGNGFFHINWGWGGMSDGYFKLDILDPESQGIGGFAEGFDFRHNAIINIRPSDGTGQTGQEPRLTQYGSLFAAMTGVRTVTFGLENYVPLGWGNANTDNVNLSIGALLEPQGETAGEKQYVESMNNEIILSPGAYYTYGDAFTPKIRVPSDLPEGTYRMSMVTKDNRSSSGVWSPVIVPYGYHDHITLVKDQSGLSVVNHSDPAMSIPDAKAMTDPVYNMPLTVSATIMNESAYELTQGVSIVLLSESGFRRFVGEGVNITLGPGESITKELTSKLNIMAGVYDPEKDIEFTLALHNPITNTYYGRYGTVKMSQGSGITDTEADGGGVTAEFDRPSGCLKLSGVGGNTLSRIYSSDGKLVASFRGENAILHGISHGIYILRTESHNGTHVSRKLFM